MAPINWEYFLNQKYAQLQQQANAQTQNAATNALTGAAAARLDTVQAQLLPEQAEAENARTRAQASLFGNQAQVVIPESRARIRSMDADTAFTDTETKRLRRISLTERQPSQESLSAVRQGFLSTTPSYLSMDPPRRAPGGR